MGGQYILRWTTLKRASSSFTPSFEITYAGQKATATASTYSPNSYQGNELQGRMMFDTSVSQSNVATLVLRASYMPRSITRLRLYFATTKAFNVQPIPYSEGGVCPTNWSFAVNQTNGVGYCEFSGPSPANPFTALPFATLGKLARFQLAGVTNLSQCFYDLSVDNSICQQTGGQTFVIDNGTAVLSPLTVLPHGTPVSWLAQYGITNNLVWAELTDPDGDGVPTWQEYLTGTNPPNRNSAFRITKLQPGNGCQITFNTELDWLYRVEFADFLNQWQTLQAGIKGNGNPTNIIDAQALKTAPGRYYRVAGACNSWKPDANKFDWILPGTFTMGSPASEPQRDSDETQHTVKISQGYWMGKYEVTQAEYLAVMGSNHSWFTGDLQRPVEQVSWYDATNYCGKLTQQKRSAGRLPSGYVYRLPTEAEWEYACRAGTTTATAFGNSLSSTQANFNGNYLYNGGAKGPYLDWTTKVGSYAANAWGLYDMHGNVWEWCWDWYGNYPTGRVTDPKGPSSGSFRVLRGGSWIDIGGNCRSAGRDCDSPGYWVNCVGFRVVLAPGP